MNRRYVAPKGIIQHPGVESCEHGPASGVDDYKHVVFLNDGWRFTRGRMEGCVTGHFDTVGDFIHANPTKESQ